MKEGQPCIPEGITNDQVLYHVGRFRSSLVLNREIETGNMPTSTWSAGEKDFKRDAKGEVMKDKEGKILFETVSLPIYGTTPRDIHCLSFAVKSAISADFDLLTEWGGHDEAMDMIREYQLMPKKGVVYEARRR